MGTVKHFVFEGETKECWMCNCVRWEAGETNYSCTNKNSHFFGKEVEYGNGCDKFEESVQFSDMVVLLKDMTIGEASNILR